MIGLSAFLKALRFYDRAVYGLCYNEDRDVIGNVVIDSHLLIVACWLPTTDQFKFINQDKELVCGYPTTRNSLLVH